MIRRDFVDKMTEAVSFKVGDYEYGECSFPYDNLKQYFVLFLDNLRKTDSSIPKGVTLKNFDNNITLSDDGAFLLKDTKGAQRKFFPLVQINQKNTNGEQLQMAVFTTFDKPDKAVVANPSKNVPNLFKELKTNNSSSSANNSSSLTGNQLALNPFTINEAKALSAEIQKSLKETDYLTAKYPALDFKLSLGKVYNRIMHESLVHEFIRTRYREAEQDDGNKSIGSQSIEIQIIMDYFQNGKGTHDDKFELDIDDVKTIQYGVANELSKVKLRYKGQKTEIDVTRASEKTCKILSKNRCVFDIIVTKVQSKKTVGGKLKSLGKWLIS